MQKPTIDSSDSDLLSLTTKIVSSHVSNTAVSTDELPALIDAVYSKLSALKSLPPRPWQELAPAVPVEESVFADHIICLEDGKPYKMLKKHLKTVYNLSPDEYRRKWNLPPDYPMVAPEYAARRQELARKSGLGHSPK